MLSASFFCLNLSKSSCWGVRRALKRCSSLMALRSDSLTSASSAPQKALELDTLRRIDAEAVFGGCGGHQVRHSRMAPLAIGSEPASSCSLWALHTTKTCRFRPLLRLAIRPRCNGLCRRIGDRGCALCM